MSKKGKTYILLVIVFGIWGTVGYQIFSKMSPEDTPILTENTTINFSPKTILKKDSFSINLKHRDPFLGKPYQKENSTKRRMTKVSKKEAIVFPSILYRGMISKQKSVANIYMVEINGTTKLFKIGSTIENIKLLKGSKKSISLSFKGERKTVSISK
jgi:hypothetical protein